MTEPVVPVEAAVVAEPQRLRFRSVRPVLAALLGFEVSGIAPELLAIIEVPEEGLAEFEVASLLVAIPVNRDAISLAFNNASSAEISDILYDLGIVGKISVQVMAQNKLRNTCLKN